MYPPRADYIVYQKDGSIIAKTAGHVIICHANGGIDIMKKTTLEIIFQKVE